MFKLTCGIDEAGRGPVIGPLVICGVVATPEQEELLEKEGVTDSKLLAPQKREALAGFIQKNITSFETVVIDPKEIDTRFEKGLSLNTLEAEKSAQIIKKLQPQKIILDCPSTNPASYIEDVQRRIGDLTPKIKAEYKADLKYTVVAAASILAKVKRDELIKQLHEKVGEDFGSGYPSDPKTKAFLQKNWNKHDVFRKTWETWKAVQKKHEQSGLGDFS